MNREDRILSLRRYKLPDPKIERSHTNQLFATKICTSVQTSNDHQLERGEAAAYSPNQHIQATTRAPTPGGLASLAAIYSSQKKARHSRTNLGDLGDLRRRFPFRGLFQYPKMPVKSSHKLSLLSLLFYLSLFFRLRALSIWGMVSAR